jgi:hypothetical protein
MILHAPYPVDGLKVVDGVSSLPLLSSDGRQQYTPLIKMQHMPAGLGYQALAGRSRFKGKGNFQSTICPKTGKLLAKEKAKAARRKAPPASKENKEVKMKVAAKLILSIMHFQKLKMLKDTIGPEQKKFYMKSESRSQKYLEDVGNLLWTGLGDTLGRKILKTRKTFRLKKDGMSGGGKRSRLSQKVDLERRKSIRSSNLILDGKVLCKGARGNNTKMLCRLSIYPEVTKRGKVLRAALKNYKHAVEIKYDIDDIDGPQVFELADASLEEYATKIYSELAATLPVFTPNSEQIPAGGVVPPTFESEEELAALMSNYGLETKEYGKGSAKSIADLLSEVRQGKCLLRANKAHDGSDELLREIYVVNVVVLARDGERCLLEYERINPNGSSSKIPIHKALPSGKLNAVQLKDGTMEEAECVEMAAVSCLKEELSIPPAMVAILPRTIKRNR